MQEATLKPLGHGGACYTVVRLTRRERQVLLLVVRGWQGKRIAAELGLTAGTIENYIKMLYTALGLANRHELQAWGSQHMPENWAHGRHYVDKRLHEPGCLCAATWCTAMRAAHPRLRELEDLEPTGTC